MRPSLQWPKLKQPDTMCRHTIQKYHCPRCERNYTSLDIASFPIQEFGFQCGECNDEGYDVPLHESFHSQDGAMIDVKEKDQRVAAAKAMLVIQLAVCASYFPATDFRILCITCIMLSLSVIDQQST